jgi:DNA-binding response OmpR family regulator
MRFRYGRRLLVASTDKQKATGGPIVFVLSPDPRLPAVVEEHLGDLCAAVFISQPRVLPSQAVGPAPALVLVDDGFERSQLDVAGELIRRWPSLRIIMLTSDTSVAGRAALARLGTLLFKPLVPERLRDAVLLRLRMAAMSARVQALREFNRPLPEEQTSIPPAEAERGADERPAPARGQPAIQKK